MFRSLPLTLFWFVYMGSVGIVLPYYSLYLKENAGLSGIGIGLGPGHPSARQHRRAALLGTRRRSNRRPQPYRRASLYRHGARLPRPGRGRRLLGHLVCYGDDSGFWNRCAAYHYLRESGNPARRRTSCFRLRARLGHRGIFCLDCEFSLDSGKLSGQLEGLHRQRPEPPSRDWGSCSLSRPCSLWYPRWSAFFCRRQGVVSMRAARGDWRLLLGNHAYIRFLIFSFAAYLLSQGPMWLFPIFVRSRGGDIETIRNMWVYMLIVEIPLVLASGSGLQTPWRSGFTWGRGCRRRTAVAALRFYQRPATSLTRADPSRRDRSGPSHGRAALSRRRGAGEIALHSSSAVCRWSGLASPGLCRILDRDGCWTRQESMCSMRRRGSVRLCWAVLSGGYCLRPNVRSADLQLT